MYAAILTDDALVLYMAPPEAHPPPAEIVLAIAINRRQHQAAAPAGMNFGNGVAKFLRKTHGICARPLVGGPHLGIRYGDFFWHMMQL